MYVYGLCLIEIKNENETVGDYTLPASPFTEFTSAAAHYLFHFAHFIYL